MNVQLVFMNSNSFILLKKTKVNKYRKGKHWFSDKFVDNKEPDERCQTLLSLIRSYWENQL